MTRFDGDEGKVTVDGIPWPARLDGRSSPPAAGDRVEVVAADGIVVWVRPLGAGGVRPAAQHLEDPRLSPYRGRGQDDRPATFIKGTADEDLNPPHRGAARARGLQPVQPPRAE